MPQFCKEHKREIVFLYVLLFLTYAIRLFCPTISIDTEILVTDPNANDPGWAGMGRWSVVLLGRLLRSDYFNLYAANVVAVIFFGLSIIALGYLFSKLLHDPKEQTAAMLIPGAVVVTSPCFAEQFGFTLQAAEVSICLFLLMVSFICLYDFLYEKQRRMGIVSWLLLMFVLGSYQSFYQLWICIASFLYALEIIRTDRAKEVRRNLFLILKYAVVFAAGAVLTEVIRSVLVAAFHIGGTNEYFGAMINWGKIPVRECLMNILKYCFKITLWPNFAKFFTFSGPIAAVLFVICVLFLIRKMRRYAILPSLALLITMSSSFLLAILMGSSAVFVRAQMTLCFTLAFFCLLTVLMFPHRRPRAAVAVICTVVMLVQFKNTSGLFLSDYSRYQEDVRYSQEIMERIDLANDTGIPRQNLKIAFVGNHASESTSVVVEGETLGKSFYDWDKENLYSGCVRICSFCRTQGYVFQTPTEEEYSEAQKYAESMETFPSKGSIGFYGDLAVVRLS